MKKDNKSAQAILRQKAEELMKKRPPRTGLQLSEYETLKLIHEMEVHQIELELLNEELTLAKESIEVAAQKYTELYDFSPSGYFTLSTEGKILELNLCGSQMLGKERSHLKNGLFGFFVSNDTRPVFNLFLGKVFNSKAKETCEVILSMNDNLNMYVHLTGIITENSEQCLVTAIDITELKQAENDILKLNEELDLRVQQRTAELEEANKELEAFSYSVSHDLHAPLRRLKGFVDLFFEKNSSQITKEEHEYLEFISRSANEMEKLIDAILSFSRLNRVELRKTNIVSSAMVQQVIKFFQLEIKNRKITFNVESLPDVKGDEELIRQVWTNLISNAIKYTGKKPEAVIDIGSTSTDKETTFFVKDNGAGFNMKYAEKLFGVFQRLHKSSDFDGVGIGLANVSRIVKRHGGYCRAEGETDNGATFYFSLPNFN